MHWRVSKLGLFSVDNGSLHQHQFYGHEYTDGRTESSSWNDVLDSCKALSGGESQKEQLYTLQKHVSVAVNFKMVHFLYPVGYRHFIVLVKIFIIFISFVII